MLRKKKLAKKTCKISGPWLYISGKRGRARSLQLLLLLLGACAALGMEQSSSVRPSAHSSPAWPRAAAAGAVLGGVCPAATALQASIGLSTEHTHACSAEPTRGLLLRLLGWPIPAETDAAWLVQMLPACLLPSWCLQEDSLMFREMVTTTELGQVASAMRVWLCVCFCVVQPGLASARSPISWPAYLRPYLLTASLACNCSSRKEEFLPCLRAADKCRCKWMAGGTDPIRPQIKPTGPSNAPFFCYKLHRDRRRPSAESKASDACREITRYRDCNKSHAGLGALAGTCFYKTWRHLRMLRWCVKDSAIRYSSAKQRS